MARPWDWVPDFPFPTVTDVRSRVLLDRRDFLKAAGLAWASTLTSGSAFALENSDGIYCSAFRDANGAYGVATVAGNGTIIDRIALSDRGHDVTQCLQTGISVAFARRPGTFALVFDPKNGSAITTITSVAGRHFFGHGCFSPDGRLLYATENDYDNFAGMIGVYDVGAGFRRIGEFPSFGIDPHDMALMENGRVLVVANGGIKTHPDHGRDKLNLDHMEPSMVFIDVAHSALMEKHALPDPMRQISTRHLDLANDGSVWFGCQFEGPKNASVPLVGRLARGEEIDFLTIDAPALQSLSQYVGSVAANSKAGTIAVSSPKGGVVLTFDTVTKALVKTDTLQGVCGLAPQGNGFVETTETGLFGRAQSDMAWDNHVLALGI
jgi:uncharacterized protein